MTRLGDCRFFARSVCVHREITVEPEYVEDVSFSKSYHGFLARETKGEKLDAVELRRYCGCKPVRYLLGAESMAGFLNKPRPGEFSSLKNGLHEVAFFVGAALAEGAVAGFYTLAATSLMLSDLPESVAKKLPRYPLVPAVLLGRLAVDSRSVGRGFGGVLLADALLRVRRSEIAACALVVDAKDEAVAAFYEHHGFIRLPERRGTLFLAVRREAIS